MALEVCGQCDGEGECWYHDEYGICPTCGGDGYVDPYFEDEWYEDAEDYDDEMTDEEWADYCAWVEGRNDGE